MQLPASGIVLCVDMRRGRILHAAIPDVLLFGGQNESTTTIGVECVGAFTTLTPNGKGF